MIDSNFNYNGNLNYAELVISGKEKREVLITTYICHPSMANNELSGPCLLTFISIMLKKNQSELIYQLQGGIVIVSEVPFQIFLQYQYQEL